MQIIGLHKSMYKLSNYASTVETKEEYIKERKKLLCDWEILKKRSVPDEEISKITGISRSTFYRRKKLLSIYGIDGLKRRSSRPLKLRTSKISKEIVDAILTIRRENMTYGKSKISVILRRDGNITLSESSVGRCLKKLKEEGRIVRSISARRMKRKPNFNQHSKRWKYGMKSKAPGEMIQIDHMTVTKHNITMKEFRAWDPITKTIVADVTSNATSRAASKFLIKVIKDLPFKVSSVQVDGGSEFMGDFEGMCKELNMELFVLPPRRPQYNGGVERGNRTFREEFYSKHDIDAESIGAFRVQLQKQVKKYNTYRPHFSLNGLTPLEYTKLILGT